MPPQIPVSEFVANFERYRALARREAVAVASHGAITGYYVAPEEYEAFRRFRRGRSFATSELRDEEAAAIAGSRMDARHDHLDRLLDQE